MADTARPWEVVVGRDGKITILGGKDGRSVVALLPPGHLEDAWLIAAAPELLEAAARTAAAICGRNVSGLDDVVEALEEAMALAAPILPQTRTKFAVEGTTGR